MDLLPRTDSGPYLEDGSVIAMKDTTIPQAVGPMLDQAGKLIESIPKERISDLLDESFTAFNGAGYDLQSLLDSASTISRDANAVSDQTRALIDDAVPLLDSQAQTTDAIRQWTSSLAGITGQIATNDPQIRTLLREGPGTAQEASRLLNDIKPTLPVLLANLTTVGQILVTYNASVEQLLVLLPPYIAAQQSYGLPRNNPTGLPLGEFSLQTGAPPPCTVGFLPPSQWRNPGDQSDIDTPDGLYCKLPQDSPLGVRGARNYPCMDHPVSGRRPSRSATATSLSSRCPSGRTWSGRIPLTPTRFHRASRRTTASIPGATGCTVRSMEPRCRRRRMCRPRHHRRARPSPRPPRRFRR